MVDRSELERRLGALYVAVRDGAAVDRQAAFDIAVNELEPFPLHAEARELAQATVADDDETRLASAAAAFLDANGYEPGFEQVPDRFARLERALDAVRADMRATGLTGEVRLVRPDWTPNAAVETWAGDTGWTGGISSPMPPTTSPRSSRWPSRLVRRSWSHWGTSPQGVCGLLARRTASGRGPRRATAPASGGATGATATCLRRSATGRCGSPGYGESHACQAKLIGALGVALRYQSERRCLEDCSAWSPVPRLPRATDGPLAPGTGLLVGAGLAGSGRRPDGRSGIPGAIRFARG